MNRALLIFCIVFSIHSESKEINATLICNHSTSSNGNLYKYIYLVELDINKKKVYIKQTTINPFYSAEENKKLREAGLYKYLEKEYEEERWTRKFKNIKGNIVWREKYGSWTLNRQNLSLRILRDDKKSDWTMYCKKSQI
tara:strand:- start:11 stop:430 length:420 start_codon:yes stop_codon:yes gene_type:complete